MANIFDGIIDQALQTQFDQGISELVRGCSSPCTVFYPPTKYVACTVCSNVNRGDRGPNPFITGGQGTHTGVCPNCNGAKKVPVTNSETIKLIIISNYPTFFNVASGVKLPEGSIQTFCKIDLIEKIKRSQYVIMNTDIKGLADYKFVRDGEPEPCGFVDQNYILTTWKKQ